MSGLKPAKIFRVVAFGDAVYIKAANQKEAEKRLLEVMGVIPDGFLSWSEVKKLPKGEEFL